MLIFDEETMKFSMGNAIVIQDNNGNFKLSKKRSEDKIDNVASTMDALVAFKENKEQFI
jgi:phage terminase large subunit-like protein